MWKPFPRAAVLVLVAGLIANAAVILYSFSSASIFSSAGAVKSLEQAKELADQYVSRLSPDLKVREVMEFSNHFYVMVQEKGTGVNAFELLVDKDNGRIFYEPGPNMMWNVKYGHMWRMMRGFRGTPSADMPITVQNASQYAQRWLYRNMPGAKVEEPEKFYGYYTIDASRNGQIFGMLSVNGYTGDVWYHSWHGQFVNMVEYE